ncbi:hypothetical protein V7S43_006469 [Phytophthora oleae]|uniref:PH domain-containing protein n=1 Tax=Phytophthora oleae TaxID=2107226 RepID=A0ABD3FRQ0_9STRA
MEGFILTVASENQHRRSFQKKKQEWRSLFVKLDDISARLIAFTDRSQFEVCWSVQLVGADISTPVPGEPSYGIDVDDTPYCFYVRETSVVKDCTHYFLAPDDSTKKAWVKALTQIARDGPRAPRFAVSLAENEFEFHARVVKFRPHVDGTHAEFMLTCSCQVFSKMVARRLAKEWNLWRRFSEFDELHQYANHSDLHYQAIVLTILSYRALEKSLGPQLEGIDLVKHKRDAFRGVLGKAFDHDFLEDRRVLLDSFVTNVCQIRTAVDFFKHHSDPHLKVFFQFDDNCQNVDESPRKASGGRSRTRNSKRSEDASRVAAASRLSDIQETSSSRASATSDANSEGGRSRSNESRDKRRSGVDEHRLSTSSQTSTSSRVSTSPRSSDTQDEGSSHHRRRHRKKSGDLDEKDLQERPSKTKKDRPTSGKKDPTISCGSAKAEVRLADPTA